jgi:Flp pilus assembly protein TadG
MIPPSSRNRRQRGVAAVELALILPIVVVLLSVPLFFGRLYWHYSAAQSAAYDAARYLSTVSLEEMRDPNKVGAVVTQAYDIVAEEVGELNPGLYAPDVAVRCNVGNNCNGFFTPTTVRVIVQVYMTDSIFLGITEALLGRDHFLLSADVTLPYTGN